MGPWDSAERTKGGEAEPPEAGGAASGPTTSAHPSAGLFLDPATKVLHHDAILAWLAHEVRRALRYKLRLAVALCDVDQLDDVNRCLGVKEGDLVLRTITEFIRKGIREYDIVGRWDADEFLVVFPHTEASMAAIPMERVREEVAHGKVVSGQRYSQ